MFGCCNNLFSSTCRCARSCGGSPVPAPTPIPVPIPTPPAPPQLRGMQLSLVGSSAGSVAHGACVPFDAVNSNNTIGVTYTPTSGVVNLSRTGTYLVNWWVGIESNQSAESVAFALSLNGSDLATSYADLGGGQIVGTAIVNVTSIPATLSLVNRSGNEVTYVTAAGQAGLTITQLA